MVSARGATQFVTPEAVSVDVDVAGLGSRMIAALIDSAIQLALLILLGLAFSELGLEGVSGAAVALGAVLLLFWGYFFVFEGMWGGRTPGKRAQRIRVVRADGQPVGWIQVAIRNLLRLVDALPTAYGIGSLSILLTRRSQRLGDLAAGTLVVRERPAPLPRPFPVPAEAVAAARAIDTTAVTDAEYSVIRSFLERRSGLVEAAREPLAAQLAAMIRGKVGGAGAWVGSDEALLEAIAASYRARVRPQLPELPSPPPAV